MEKTWCIYNIRSINEKFQLSCMRLRTWGRVRFTDVFNSFESNIKKLIFFWHWANIVFILQLQMATILVIKMLTQKWNLFSIPLIYGSPKLEEKWHEINIARNITLLLYLVYKDNRKCSISSINTSLMICSNI